MAKKKTKTAEKIYTDFPHIVKEINILRDFCNKMGYTWDEYYYEAHFYENSIHRRLNGTKFYAFDINDKSDSEGNAYSWEWSMVTGKEFQ